MGGAGSDEEGARGVPSAARPVPEGWRASGRSAVRRHPERGRYDRETIESILDEGFVCHVGFSTDDGPVVLPTAYARVADVLYLHGAAANHALRTLEGAQACVSVTLVDGVVLARAAFHHSINYRSVVVFGRAVAVSDPEEKRAALEAVVEHIVPGRTLDARGPSDAELRATRVVRVLIEEASAKVRAGGPVDDPDDVEAGGIWAGHVPLVTMPGPPMPDPLRAPHEHAPLALPEYVAHYRRPGPAGGGARPGPAGGGAPGRR